MSLPKSVLDQNISQDGSFSYTFRQIIDADHSAINRIAGRIRKILASATPASSLAELNSLLLEITWRLIRHDFSEDIVMRPAFASVLGQSGVAAVQRDRADHAGGRDMLLNIMKELERVGEDLKAEKLVTVVRMVTETFDELGEHMRVESGEVLPHFESVISRDMSMKLAREYMDTLVITPSLTRRAHDDEGPDRQVAFRGGVKEYIHTPVTQLREVYARILEETTDEREKLWFDETAQRELDKIQIGRKQKSGTVVDPGQSKEQKERTKAKVPTNALGLPISWHDFKKARL